MSLKPAFKDHFSTQSDAYAQFRPTYPEELFGHLADVCGATKRAWDCATGSGQAAMALSKYFDKVVATDASQKQLQNAKPRPNIKYKLAPSENSQLPSNSCDLITVAQALHWFNFQSFFDECRRVAKPESILAVWSYNLLKITPEIDSIINEYYFNVVGDFWPEERKHVEAGYRSIDFPFKSLTAPNFSMTDVWTLDHLLGYLTTWSATQKFIKTNRNDPIKQIEPALKKAWGNSNVSKEASWPLKLLLYRIDK